MPFLGDMRNDKEHRRSTESADRKQDFALAAGGPIAAKQLSEIGEVLGDLRQPLFDDSEPRRYRVFHVFARLAEGWRDATMQDSEQMLRVQTERDRKRFERPVASLALHGVVLDFADDRLGDLRALSQFALLPSELVYALVDGLRDRRPVFRHLFLFLRGPPQRRH